MTKLRNPACYSILFFVALGGRLYFLFNHGVTEVFGKYPYFAGQMAEGQDLGERLLDLSPLYLHIMAFNTRYLGFSLGNMEAAQLFLGGLNTLLIFAIGSRLLGRLPGFLAALAYACHGNIMALESTFEPLVLLLFLSLGCLFFLSQAQSATQNPNKRIICMGLAGALAGLALITKPNFGLFCLGTAIWILTGFDSRLDWNRRLVLALVFCGVAGLAVMPVSVRNYIKFNDFILVSDSYGRLFYNGNGGNATGVFPQNLEGQDQAPGGVIDPDHSHAFFRERASRMAGRDLKPSESARFWFAAGLQDLKASPRRAMMLWGQKLALFFHGYENHLIDSAYFKYQWTLGRPFLSFRWIAGFAILGMLVNLRRMNRLFPVYWLVFSFLISCLIFMVNSRYRAPALPALCLFAGAGAVYLMQWIRARDWKRTGLGILAFGVFLSWDAMAFREAVAAHDRAFQPELRRPYVEDRPSHHSWGSGSLPRKAESSAPVAAAIPPHSMAR